MKAVLAVLAVLPVLAVILLMGLVVLVSSSQVSTGGCGPVDSVRADAREVTDRSVAGYRGDQLGNAATIINAGHALGVSLQGQTIAVMTAMGESGLRVLDYGDAVGPDSRGLFQQRAAGWGSYAERMNPTVSATNFYRALLEVDGWELLPPTFAAHRTQRNADPYHYEKYWESAVTVVRALTGSEASLPGAGPGCVAAGSGDLSASGWTRPSPGRVSSPFGYRIHPILGYRKLHRGIDFAAPCGDPIRAAADGIVVKAGPAAGYGNVILVDHGRDSRGQTVVTAYAHMFANGLRQANGTRTQVGQRVAAGQQIAQVGTTGSSTGCHLHFEVRIDGRAEDPAKFEPMQGVLL